MNNRNFSHEELCTRWTVDAAGLKRLVGDKTTLTLEEVREIEERWKQELLASRAAWNQRITERKGVTE